MQQLKDILRRTKAKSILPKALLNQPFMVFNLAHPSDFADINPTDTQSMMQKTQELLQQNCAAWAIGQYAEERVIYQHAQYLTQQRNVHLGLDLSAPVNTPVYAPIAGTCHSFYNNASAGDYGPTIILEHSIDNVCFYTLYGHLTQQSLHGLEQKTYFAAGELLGHIGDVSENGGWPPHLHFQIISDIGDHIGNFPGVCHKKEATQWLLRCPDPNLLLKLF